jgi:tetratricopeptide (TPR) repeat protein
METTRLSCPALPENHGVAARSSSQITSSALLDVLLGICAATELPEQTVERFRHCLSPPSSQISSSYSSSKSAVEENFQINSGAKCWFSGWYDVLAPFLSENDAELPHLLNLGLAVAFLRESRQQSRTINREDLTILWDFVHDALISPQFTRPLSTLSYSAQGFFIIPICSLTGQNGDGDELYRLHIWLPYSQRDPDFCIHSCQALVQSWILAGDGQYNTFEVESTADLEHATHAEFQLVDGLGQQDNDNQNGPILRNTGRLVHAIKTHSSVHTLDTSHRIEPGTWHALEVASDSLHAGIFLLNPRLASGVDARILGPKNVDHRVPPSRQTDVTPALLASSINSIRLWNILFDDGKWHARRSEMEDALRVFNNALSLCATAAGFPNASHYARLVHGELGFTKRCLGRYDLAKEHLEEALKEIGLNHHRVKASGELGTVFRIQGQLLEARTAFQTQYEIAKTLGDHRAACRAIGNVGMTNYQLFQQRHDDTLLELAIEQLKERVNRARQIKQALNTEKMDPRKKFGRLKHASVWESIGLNRLSLCYTAQGNTREAINVAKESQNIKIEPKDPTVIAMSHFFYGRALLRGGQRKAAMEHFNPSVACTPVIALCKEPSEENRQYLQELVDAGVDMDHVDEYGYTGLDYTVFGMDVDMEEIVIEGLRHTLKGDIDVEIVKRQYEARLRKSYRELFHDKMRPVLLKGGADTLKNLRIVYAAALAAKEQEGMTQRFGTLKCVRYSDFLRCGRLPRHSDGFAKDLSSELHALQGLAGEFMIFFSYRWINKEGNRSFPDDAENTQYHRMVHATRDFLKLDSAVDPDRLGIWLVRRQHWQTIHSQRGPDLHFHRTMLALTKTTLRLV